MDYLHWGEATLLALGPGLGPGPNFAGINARISVGQMENSVGTRHNKPGKIT